MPDVEQDHRIASIASRMTQLNMIDALYVITFNRIGNKVLDQFMETREEALRLRKLVEEKMRRLIFLLSLTQICHVVKFYFIK